MSRIFDTDLADTDEQHPPGTIRVVVLNGKPPGLSATFAAGIVPTLRAEDRNRMQDGRRFDEGAKTADGWYRLRNGALVLAEEGLLQAGPLLLWLYERPVKGPRVRIADMLRTWGKVCLTVATDGYDVAAGWSAGFQGAPPNILAGAPVPAGYTVHEGERGALWAVPSVN